MDHPRRSWSHRRRLAQPASYVLTFDGINDLVSCSHDASLANLADEVLTVDAWLKYTAPAATTVQVADKGTHASINEGWALWIDNFDRARFLVRCATTNADAVGPVVRGTGWHHVVGFFNDGGDRLARVAVDGVWYVAGAEAVGASHTDSTRDLVIARLSGLGAQFFRGSIAWLRISNDVRFDPDQGFAGNLPSRCTPPAVDASTVELWAMNEGAGSAATASVTSPANDGAITGAIWEPCR